MSPLSASFFWLHITHETLLTTGRYLENTPLEPRHFWPHKVLKLDPSYLVGAEGSFTFDLFVGLKHQNHRADEMGVRGGAQGLERDEVT